MARFCIQVFDGPHIFDQYPIQLAQGKQAPFMISFRAAPDWPRDFLTNFVEHSSLRTLRAQIHTSVRQSIEVVPAESLMRRLRSVREVTH
jgi:hypothetical protein